MSEEPVLLVTGDVFARHDTGRHPENQGRLEAIVEHLHQTGLYERCQVLAPRSATVGELTLVHDRAYVDMVRSAGKEGGGWLDYETLITPGTYEASCHAVGAGLVAAERILAGDLRRALCLVRPPGHHARPSRGMGFCIFNNVAIAACWLLSQGLERLLIVDWDYHHGNGTEEAFYDDLRVFYLSLHLYGPVPLSCLEQIGQTIGSRLAYPGTGGRESRGRGPGEGFTLNVPLSWGTSAEEYLRLFAGALDEACARSQPECILISAGFDAYRHDQLSGHNLEVADFGRLTDLVVAQAEVTAQGRVLSMLEGGYGGAGLARCVAEHLRRLGRLDHRLEGAAGQ